MIFANLYNVIREGPINTVKIDGFNLLYSYFWAYIIKIDIKRRDQWNNQHTFWFWKIYLYLSIGCSIYEKISKSRFLTLHISEPFWPRNLHFFCGVVSISRYTKKFWSLSDFGNMGNEGAENRDFGHFNRFVYFSS